MATARFIVSGTVQGVFFRASARERAVALGLAGHAKNMEDSRVEVLASGSADAVNALEAWLQQGPPLARVHKVFREDLVEQDLFGFITG